MRLFLVCSVLMALPISAASVEAAPLSPGIYSIGASSHIQIARRGDRLCFAGSSRNGSSFASLHPDATPGSYRVNGFEGTLIAQQDTNTIRWGPKDAWIPVARDRELEQENFPIAKDLQRCLNSNQPFFRRYSPPQWR